MEKITLKDIQVLNEAVELLGRALSHSREATLAPLVKQTRDKLVTNYRAQALAETEAALSQAVTPELLLILAPRHRGLSAATVGTVWPFANFDTPRSKVVRRLAYNFHTRELRVHFVNGHVWSYLNVPHNVFNQVLEGDGPERSVGAAYNRLLKGRSESAPVVKGERQPLKEWTVVFSRLGQFSGLRLKATTVVKAFDDLHAREIAKRESGNLVANYKFEEVREGHWKLGFGDRLYKF